MITHKHLGRRRRRTCRRFGARVIPFDAADDPDQLVYLRGDGGVQLQDLTEITDKLKDAGVEHVGLVTKMPGERQAILENSTARLIRKVAKG